ncbi:hypothetical protein FY526_28255, partial [Clostridioides difficile]
TYLSQYDLDRKVSQFDISLSMEEVRGKIICETEYRSRLFSSETIEQMMRHYVKILIEISTNTDQSLRDIELLDNKEKEQLLTSFNDTRVEFPQDKTVIDLFEERTKEHPSQTALVHGDSI